MPWAIAKVCQSNLSDNIQDVYSYDLDANFSDTEEEMVRRQLSTKIEGSDSSSDASEILKPENGSRMVYFPDEDDTI